MMTISQLHTTSVALTAHDLWKSYGNHTVVQGVSFTLNPGEILGLLGANGAGKTTTVGMLYGTVVPSRGFVQLGQLSHGGQGWEETSRQPPPGGNVQELRRLRQYQIQSQGREARAAMGIVTQEDNLDPDFTVFENLTVFAHHYRIVGKAARKRAGELLALVGLQDYAHNHVNELSGGMQRRLVLARALINNPRVIFLDEPTTGLDPDARQDFWRLLGQLKQNDCGVLLTTHYMDEAQRLCDRLLLLQQGKMIDQGTPTELIERTVGQEVVEIGGISETTLQQLVEQAGTWYRPFGSAYLIGLPVSDPKLWEQLTTLASERLTRRRANLEDVFLRLTSK